MSDKSFYVGQIVKVSSNIPKHLKHFNVYSNMHGTITSLYYEEANIDLSLEDRLEIKEINKETHDRWTTSPIIPYNYLVKVARILKNE